MIPFRDDVPAKRYPVVTVGIIVLNVLVFFYQLSLPRSGLEQFIFAYGVVPGQLGQGGMLPAFSVSMLTSIFLHGGWFHLFGNMWYLWIFGDNIEDRMGHFRFLMFYLICGLLAGATHVLANSGSEVPSIGASGAVAGILGAYLLSYPFARILTVIPLFLFWPIVELPAVIVLGSWFFIQILNGSATIAATSQTTGGVAWWAHVGGFVAGMLLLTVFAKRKLESRKSGKGARGSRRF